MPCTLRKIVLLALFALSTLNLAHAQAQSDQAALQTRLIGNTLILRGFYASNKLDFDSAGQLSSDSQITSFTLSGVKVNSLQVKKDQLVLHAERIAFMWKDDSASLVPAGLKNEKLTLTIEPDAGGHFDRALDAIFASNFEQIAPSLASEWQPYAQAHFQSPASDFKEPSTCPATEPDCVRPGINNVTNPALLHSVDASFNNSARKLKVNGTVHIGLIVNEQGMPVDLRILRPLGVGLDESAIDSVRQYRFKPSLRNGVPVAVHIVVIASFVIYKNKAAFKKNQPARPN